MEKGKFDLIFLDYLLPDGNGLEFIEAVNSKGLETPVIMTTGFSTLQNAVQALLVGAGAVSALISIAAFAPAGKNGFVYDLLQRGPFLA